MHDFQQHQTHHAFPAASNAPVSALDTSKGLDVREVIWLKLQVLKDEYLQDMKELYNMLTQRSTMPMPPEQLQKLKHYKDVLQRMIPYLTVPKERVPREFNQDKVEAFEKQIVNIMETFKRRRHTPSQQPVLPPQQQLQPNQVPQPPQQQQQPGPLSQKQLHLKEALQSVQQQHAQLQQQWQQQMLQQQQRLIQQQQQILQQQEVLQKHLLQQQQLFQQQKVLQEQQQQEDMISAVTGCFSRLPLN